MTLSHDLSVDDLPKRPSGRILRARDAQAWQDGFQFLASARSQAEQLMADARRSYANEFAQGYEDGKAEGAVEAAKLLSNVALKVDRYLESVEEEVADLALEIVRRVIGEFEPDVLVAKAARQAVWDLRRSKCLKLSVHPDAVPSVRDQLDDILIDSDLGLNIEIVSNAGLDEGACTITTDASVVYASLNAQLGVIAATITEQTKVHP